LRDFKVSSCSSEGKYEKLVKEVNAVRKHQKVENLSSFKPYTSHLTCQLPLNHWFCYESLKQSCHCFEVLVNKRSCDTSVRINDRYKLKERQLNKKQSCHSL
jgi:hypothetical protein